MRRHNPTASWLSAWTSLFGARPDEPAQELTRVQWGVGIGATLLAVCVHAIYLFNGGGLWRDEVSSLHMATLPTLGETWRALDVPAFFPATVRGWCALGLGHGDFGLRTLGFIIGLSILGALWWNAWIMKLGVPFISLGLLAANLTLVRWGDSLRAYGAGSLLILLALGQIWAMIQQPNRRRFLLACLVAILSVQSLYQNAFLLAAACSGASVVCLLRRSLKTAGLVFMVGLAAAISLLPYTGHLKTSGSGWQVLQTGFDAHLGWFNLSIGLGSPLVWQRWIWLSLLVLTGGVGIASLDRKRRIHRVTAADLTLYGAFTACAGVVGFFVFLALAKLPTQPWYYLPLMTFVAMCMDASLSRWSARLPMWRTVFASLMVCVSLPFALSQARCRQTNIDLIAAWLHEHAKPNDLIIVYPWYCGVTFDHYYQGAAHWTTLPSLADHRLHRYDLLMEKLAAKAPIQDVLDRAFQTLTAGNDLWIVGQLPAPEPGETQPPVLPPAPEGPLGWFDEPYTYVWGRQADQYVRNLARYVDPVSLEPAVCVNQYEDLALFHAGASGLNPPRREAP